MSCMLEKMFLTFSIIVKWNYLIFQIFTNSLSSKITSNYMPYTLDSNLWDLYRNTDEIVWDFSKKISKGSSKQVGWKGWLKIFMYWNMKTKCTPFNDFWKKKKNPKKQKNWKFCKTWKLYG